MKFVRIAIITAFFSIASFALNGYAENSPETPEEFVRNAVALSKKFHGKSSPEIVSTPKVAEAIHEAVSIPFYGEETILAERPFKAVRYGEYWLVTGYLPPDALGGTAVSVIRASNGEVLLVQHQQ